MHDAQIIISRQTLQMLSLLFITDHELNKFKIKATQWNKIPREQNNIVVTTSLHFICIRFLAEYKQ